MSSSFIHLRKPSLAAHWNACKLFLLLSGWAALAAYTLMLLCLFPYPTTVTELVTVFLKMISLSNATTLGLYVVWVAARMFMMTLLSQLRSKIMVKAKRNGTLVQELFSGLSAEPGSLLTEPVLYCEENAALPSFCYDKIHNYFH